MSTVSLDLDEDLLAVLRQENESVSQAVRELTVVELFRRGTVSGGKAAALLGMSRLDFIHFIADLGITYFDLTNEEWESERAFIDSL